MVGDLGPSPSPAMYDRAARLRADIGALGKNIRRDWSHRDDPQASTTCAGNTIQAWVDSGGPTKTTTPTTDWFDMATKADLEAVIKPLSDKVDAFMTVEANRYQRYEAIYRDLVARITNDEDVDPAALAAALAPILVEQLPDSPLLTQEQIEAAFRAVLGSVNDTPEVPA
jgi:hypothetical protein